MTRRVFRTRTGRACALLALLALCGAGVPLPVEADPLCVPADAWEVPAVAARDGTPFAVGFVPASCFSEAFEEVRVWVGNATHQASRIGDGSGWLSSQSYVPVSAALAHGTALWLALAAAPSATHGATLVTGAAGAEVWMRARGPAGASDRLLLGVVEWVDADAVSGWWGSPDEPVVTVRDEAGGLLAAAPAGLDGDGLPLPSGFTFLARGPAAPPAPPPPVAPGDVLLVRVAPALRPEGSLVEWVVRDAALDLAGLRVVSRSGSVVLSSQPVGAAGVVRLVSSPGLAVAPLAAHVPDLVLGETATVAWGDDGALEAGRFRLAQAGGSVELVYGDVVLDAFAYGDGAPPRGWVGAATEATRIPGRVFLRAWDAAGFVDSDGASDWERPRLHRQHQADVATRWFDVAGPVRLFACPDRCLEEVALRIADAQHSLDVNLYELTLVEAVEALVAAALRGVAVRVLVDERPVGAAGARLDRIAWAVDRLLGAGAEVRVMGRERFDVNHAKYLVVDGAWTVVLTENAVRSGWPPDGASGNRGYGVAVQDGGLAAWLGEVFAADALHAHDSRAITGRDLHPDAQPPALPVGSPVPVAERLPTLVLDGGFPVAPLLAPDHLGDAERHPLVELLDATTGEAGLQQLNLPLEWRRPGHASPSPLAVAILGAAERGVYVNGTLAGAFVEEGRDGNDVTAATLSAASTRVDLRLAGTRDAGGVLHAKVWWGDPGSAGGWAVVGSANGNLASQALNRELALVLAHPEAAAFLSRVAALDHADATVPAATAPPAGRDAEPQPVPALGAGLAVVAACLFAALCRRRRAPDRS